MEYNALVVDWTMNDYEAFKRKLADVGFRFAKETDGEHISVFVPLERIREFAALCQDHLNAEYNYVDIQFPAGKKRHRVSVGVVRCHRSK